MAWTIASILAGVLLLALVAADVFLTVFGIEGTGGPLTTRLSRTVWRIVRWLGVRRDGSLRETILAYGGPAIVVLSFLAWVMLLLVGYALIYLPFIRTDFIFASGHVRIPFWEAVYFSAQAAPTLGTGDMVPNLQSLRIVEVIESMSGFAVVTSAVTYLLAIYEELLARHTTAVVIANFFDDGLTRTLERIEKTGGDEVGRWADSVAGSVVRALEAHYQYPIVHYFRVISRRRAFAVQIGRLLDLNRAVSEGRPSPEVAADVRAHPSYNGLMVALREYLSEVETHFIPERFARHLIEREPNATVRAYGRLLLYLHYDEAARARRPGIEAGTRT